MPEHRLRLHPQGASSTRLRHSPLIPDEASLLLSYPDVPVEQRPKALYIADPLSEECREHLRAKGWEPTDVRLLPNRTDGDRAEAVKAYLEGARIGSLTLTKDQRASIELEAKICGLLNNKGIADDQSSRHIESNTLDILLNIGTNRLEASGVHGPPSSTTILPPAPLASSSEPRKIRKGKTLKKHIDKLKQVGRPDIAAKLEAVDGAVASL